MLFSLCLLLICFQQGDTGKSSVEEEQVVVVLDLSEFIDLALSVKKVSSCLSASQKSLCWACWRFCFHLTDARQWGGGAWGRVLPRCSAGASQPGCKEGGHTVGERRAARLQVSNRCAEVVTRYAVILFSYRLLSMSLGLIITVNLRRLTPDWGWRVWTSRRLVYLENISWFLFFIFYS